MTYTVSSGTLNPTQLNSTHSRKLWLLNIQSRDKYFLVTVCKLLCSNRLVCSNVRPTSWCMSFICLYTDPQQLRVLWVSLWRSSGTECIKFNSRQTSAPKTLSPSGSFYLRIAAQSCSCAIHVHCLNPLKGSGIRWLHFKVFSAIQV